jgi:XTP/dITP diphosphohydrolase
MRKLLIASENQGKMREIKALLADLNLEIVTPRMIGLHLEVVEDGQTYAENATRKAVAFAQASRLVALADDSGLEVDALDGAPGLYSARYAPIPNATDADRRKYLLMKLRGKPRPWIARFRATVAISAPDRPVRLAAGECQGEIIPIERGQNGFGYDPIFIVSELGHTMAELSMDEKNRLSHRAKAVHLAIPILNEIFFSH